MAIKYYVKAAISEFKGDDGSMKKRYQSIGIVMETKHGLMLKIESLPVFAMKEGAILAYLNEPEKAIADYTKALSINPKLESVYYNRGITYANLRKYPEAIADYNSAIDLNPNNFNLYFNRAIAYGNINQWDKSVIDLRKVLELDPGNKSAASNLEIANSRLKIMGGK